MFRVKKAIAVTAAITVLVLGAAPTAAFAVTSGCGSTCDGQNPQTYSFDHNGGVTTCAADAVTKRTATISQAGGIVIILRYSAVCRTAWAQTNGYDYTIYLYSYKSNGSLRRTESTDTTDSVRYTRMVNDAGLTARACIVVPVSDGDQICTSKY